MASTAKKRTRKKTATDEVKISLMNKYRETFIDKLTRRTWRNTGFTRGSSNDKEHGWNNEYRLKFEFKLRQYFHEEILTREIASIETLLGLLQPEDLENVNQEPDQVDKILYHSDESSFDFLTYFQEQNFRQVFLSACMKIVAKFVTKSDLHKTFDKISA